MTGDDTYLFLKSPQGDVLGITRVSDRKRVVNFTYDPWGRILTANYHSTLTDNDKLILKLICPFRYRGYCYDSDIGLYYLQSRYYNPVWGRFINVDDTTILLSTVGETHNANLFAYCSNNPVNRVDYTGKNDNPVSDCISIIIILIILHNYYDKLYNDGIINENYYNVDKYKDKDLLGWTQIKLSDSEFSNAIFTCFNISKYYTSEILAAIICDAFNLKLHRQFLFSNDCVCKEIQSHLNAAAVNNKYLKQDDQIYTNHDLWSGFLSLSISNIIDDKTMQIDLGEKDVYYEDISLFVQNHLYSYRSGIRDCYKNTFADPYYKSEGHRYLYASKNRTRWESFLNEYSE